MKCSADPLRLADIQAASQASSKLAPPTPQWTGPELVDVLLAYLNRGDLLHDLRETVRQLREAVTADDTPARSVKTIVREGGTRRLSNRLTDEQVRELVATFEAGEATRLELAERYGIGRTSVAKVLRQQRNPKSLSDVQ